MIRTLLAATALLFATTASAQSQRERLDERYNQALAAGYKALFLCSAIANAEHGGKDRSVESVEDWELTGIQAPLDSIVGELDPQFVWSVQARTGGAAGDSKAPIALRELAAVGVAWDDAMPARFASYRSGAGCSLLPIGSDMIRPAGDVAFTGDIAPGEPANTVGLLRNESAQRPRGDVSLRIDGAFADAYGEGTRTSAIMVGNSQRQLYWRFRTPFGPATPQRTWSVAKSLAATIIGAAVHRGEADVNAIGVFRGVPDEHPLSDISIDNLLRMASGRYSDTPGNRTDPLYYGGSSVLETAMDWPVVHRPGTEYRYANNDTLIAVKAIEATFADHSPAEFFAKLRMVDTVAETDWRGDYILSSQVWTTAPDLLRFGQLYLNDGVLPNGERILPEGWVNYVSSPSGPQPEGRPFGYGAGFWLMNQSEGVPADTIAAFGNRGQYVVIIPSRDLVIVRRGEDPTGSRFDIAGFTRDVLAALDK